MATVPSYSIKVDQVKNVSLTPREMNLARKPMTPEQIADQVTIQKYYGNGKDPMDVTAAEIKYVEATVDGEHFFVWDWQPFSHISVSEERAEILAKERSPKWFDFSTAARHFLSENPDEMSWDLRRLRHSAIATH